MTGWTRCLWFLLSALIFFFAFLLACDDDPVDQAEEDAEEADITEGEACTAYCKKTIKCQIWDWTQEECMAECTQWYNGSSMGKCYYDCLDRDCDNFFDCTSGCNTGGGGSAF